MKKTLFAVVSIYIISLSFSLAQEQKIRVTAERADIYIEPHKSSTVIETVNRGAILNLFETSGEQTDWFYVSFYSETKWATITGFIEAGLVALVAGEEPERATPEKVPAKRPQAKKPRPKPVEKPQAEKPVEKVLPVKEPELEEPQMELVKYAGKIKIVAEEALIRSFAGKKGRIIQALKLGDEFETSGKQGDWFQVKYPRPDGIILVGYINQDQVEVLAGEPPEPKALEEVKVTEVKPEPEKKIPEELIVKEEAEYAEPSKVKRASRSKIGLGVFGGYGIPGDSNFNSGIRFGGSLTFLINDYLALEISDAYFRPDVKGSVDSLSKGRLTQIPLIFSVQGRYPIKGKFVPYLAFGAGYAFNSFKLDSDVKAPWVELGFSIEESIDNAFALQFGGGVDYFINQYLAVFIDFRYLKMTAGGSWSFTDQFSGIERSGVLNDLKLDTLFFGLGLKIYLGVF